MRVLLFFVPFHHPDLARIISSAPAKVLALLAAPDQLTQAVEAALARGPAAARAIRRAALQGKAGLRRRRAEFRERFGLMTEAEACAFLQCGRDAIRRYRRDSLHPIPALPVGRGRVRARRYLYPVDGLFAWLERARDRELRAQERARRRAPPTGRRYFA
jgi:hypothetical protein